MYVCDDANCRCPKCDPYDYRRFETIVEKEVKAPVNKAELVGTILGRIVKKLRNTK